VINNESLSGFMVNLEYQVNCPIQVLGDVGTASCFLRSHEFAVLKTLVELGGCFAKGTDDG